MFEVIIYIITAIFSFIGIFLTMISLPGVWLIYLSTIIIALIDKFQTITPEILLILLAISVFSTLIDNIVNAIGVKILGGSIWGIIGAILGGIVGLIISNIFGIIIGPLIGAFLFEYIFGRKGFKESIKAGLGTFLGMLLTVVLKTGINIGIIVFVVSKLINN